MAKITSQQINQALWPLIEAADETGKYAGVEGSIVVERMTRAVQRELPAEFTN
jgi:hypothetical protein